MAIGKIKGPMLFDDLARQGVNLSFDGNLLYLDVTNRRLGVGTVSPQYGLDVPANVRLANLTVLGNTITSNTGKIGLGSISNITVTGGQPNYIIYTDGAGNLSFGNLNALSLSEGFTGNNITLGINSLGSLSNALGISTTTSVTDGIALLNRLLGNITDATGTNIHINGNVIAQGNLSANYLTGNGSLLSGVSMPITVSEYFYGDIANVVPHISTLRFDRSTGFTVQDLGANTALISMSSSFKTWVVDGQANLVAFGEDTVKFATDNNIAITTVPTATPIKTITFSLANNISVSGNVTASGITATNGFKTANAVITGGYINGLANVSATTATIGNISFANSTVTSSNVIVINSNSAIQIPRGGVSQRPAGVSGMIRFNTDTPALEYFDGSIWVPVTNTITDQQITGDGTHNVFTLDQASTDIGVIVSINGTLQRPGSAYSISGTQITFVETPLSDDVIDIRFLGATVSVSSTVYDDLTIAGNLSISNNVTLSGILSAPQITKASNALGTVGQICWDANYIYVCTATNTWKRSPLTGGY